MAMKFNFAYVHSVTCHTLWKPQIVRQPAQILILHVVALIYDTGRACHFCGAKGPYRSLCFTIYAVYVTTRADDTSGK